MEKAASEIKLLISAHVYRGDQRILRKFWPLLYL
jgi:hypothetical protein